MFNVHLCVVEGMLLGLCPGPAPVASLIPSAWRNALLQDMSSCRKQNHAQAHTHICQKWSRLPLKGPDTHIPGRPSVHPTCTQKHSGPLFCSCCSARHCSPDSPLWVNTAFVDPANGVFIAQCGLQMNLCNVKVEKSFNWPALFLSSLSYRRICCILLLLSRSVWREACHCSAYELVPALFACGQCGAHSHPATPLPRIAEGCSQQGYCQLYVFSLIHQHPVTCLLVTKHDTSFFFLMPIGSDGSERYHICAECQ